MLQGVSFQGCSFHGFSRLAFRFAVSLIFLLAAEGDGAKVAGKVFNVGCGESIDLLQLTAELNRQTGQNLAPVHMPPRTGDIKHSAADISAARAGLNYVPEVTWQKGLEHTLDFYRAGNK